MRRLLPSLRTAAPYAVAVLAVAHYVRGIAVEMVTARPEILDFDVYYRAARAVASGAHLYAPYTGCCFEGSAMDGYTYPPLLAVLLSPLSALPVGVAGRVFLGLSQLCLAGALVLMHLTVRGMVTRRTEAWLLAAVLLFQPIHAGNGGIQVENVLLLLLAGAAHGTVRGRAAVASGALLGLGAALKLTPALVLPALVTRRGRWAAMAVGGFALALAVPTLLAWTVAPETPGYLTGVLPRFAGGVASQYSRSLPGVILRTYGDSGRVAPAIWATVFHVTQLAALVFTWLWCRRASGSPAARAATMAAFVALVPITEPVAWDHHMASDALAFVLLAPSLRMRSIELWAAGAGMALMSVNELVLTSMLQGAGLDPPQGLGTAVYLAGVSVNLVGMVLLYGTALHVAGRLRTRGEPRGLPVTGRRVARVGRAAAIRGVGGPAEAPAR
ncbi:MAG TPA: glycosyltransferase family 87 protein [Candidatus Dormibacteraeota bacterium]|nr:glycosyltransferase family 87 protein [Candidatus Dormibacteraeota bacterium]